MPQLVPGQVIQERYQLQRPVGRGGFSVVWLAVDLIDTRPVALKISLPDKDSTGQQPARMERQHQTTAQLNHPHLLRSHDFFKIENAGCLVFDYMANGTLHDKVKKEGSMPEKEIAKVMLQIGDALQYLHSHSLIHFDVKPENVLIDAKGDYFLSDFDTASQLENSMVRVSRIFADTPQYRSPEHLRGAAELSEKVDIFAFGTTLFELCEGIMEKEFGIGMVLLSGGEKPNIENKAYSRFLEQIVKSCWNHNPADRPSADALYGYARHFLEKGFWMRVLEHKPDDRPYADLPTSSGGTARVTVGRPTVIDPNPLGAKQLLDDLKKLETQRQAEEQPAPAIAETFIPRVPAPENSRIEETMVMPEKPKTDFSAWLPPQPEPPKPKETVKKMDDDPSQKVEKQSLRIFMAAGLLLLLLIAGFFIGKKIMKQRAFNNHYEAAAKHLAEGNLKPALLEIDQALKIRAGDSVAFELKRDIMRVGTAKHSEVLNEVRAKLDAKDYGSAMSLLLNNRENASVLGLFDSTQMFLSMLPPGTEPTGGVSASPAPEEVLPSQQSQNVASALPSERPNNPGENPGGTDTGNGQVSTAEPASPASTETDPPKPTDPTVLENQDWDYVKTSNSPKLLKDFTKKWPKGSHRTEAEHLLNGLEENDWAFAKSKNTVAAYNSFIGTWPESHHRGEAEKKIGEINDGFLAQTEDNDWLAASGANTADSYQKYVDKYPNGKYAGEARKKIAVSRTPVSTEPAEPPCKQLSQSGLAGLSTADQKSSSATDKSGSWSVVLTPGPSGCVQLSSAVLWVDVCGEMSISLKGDKIDQDDAVTLVAGKNQISFVELNGKMKPGKKYTLTFKPLTSSDGPCSGNTPKFKNYAGCGKHAASPSLVLNDNGNSILFDLKFKY